MTLLPLFCPSSTASKKGAEHEVNNNFLHTSLPFSSSMRLGLGVAGHEPRHGRWRWNPPLRAPDLGRPAHLHCGFEVNAAVVSEMDTRDSPRSRGLVTVAKQRGNSLAIVVVDKAELPRQAFGSQTPRASGTASGHELLLAVELIFAAAVVLFSQGQGLAGLEGRRGERRKRGGNGKR